MQQIMKLKVTITIIMLLAFTSCIKEINLFKGKDEEEKNDKEESSPPIYLYPFAEEIKDITAEIIIHTNKKININEINTEIPYLKYNKTWLLMLTQDDCKHSAFCRTWAAINGKPISSSNPAQDISTSNNELYFDIRQLLKGDLPPNIIPATHSLGSTDGAGNEVRFAITTTLSPEEEWMNAETIVKPGLTDNYYRFFMKSGLVWDNIKEMLNFGTGIAFHDVKATDVNNPSLILTHFKTAQNIILEKLSGRGCKFLAEPNGNKTYITAALQYSDLQTITLQTEGVTLYPFKVTDDLQKTLIQREFNNSTTYFKQLIYSQLRQSKENRKAICIGVHETDNNWVSFLNWLNDNYGKDGDDSLWFPSQEEYYEYNYYRMHGGAYLEQLNGDTFKLIVKLPREEYFYYPSITINVTGIHMQNITSIESDNTVTGLSYGNFDNGITLNIDCRKRLTEHAEHFVERYEADQSNQSNKADATYFVDMLKDSDTKTNLLNRLK